MLRPGGFAGPGFEGQGETAYSDGSNLDIVDAVADRVMACNADRTRFRQAGNLSHSGSGSPQENHPSAVGFTPFRSGQDYSSGSCDGP